MSDDNSLCSPIPLTAPPNLFIPTLDLSKVKNDNNFQNEFLSTKDLWSESWREQADDMPTAQE